MASFKEIAEILVFLGACYPNAGLSPASVEAYAEMLRDLPFESLLRAAQIHVYTSPYFPTIAELRRLATNSNLPSAAEAWGEVLRAVREVGSYGTPSFSHPLISAAVHCLGWVEICRSENPEAVRAHFFQIYEQLLSEAKKLEVLPTSLRSGVGTKLVRDVLKELEFGEKAGNFPAPRKGKAS